MLRRSERGGECQQQLARLSHADVIKNN